MMANTWATVYRGDDSTALGDPIDLDTPVDGLEHFPMAITEKTRTVFEPETDTARTIRFGVGRAKFGSDIQPADRIFDERTSRYWVVSSVSGGGFTFYGAQDLSLMLRAV